MAKARLVITAVTVEKRRVSEVAHSCGVARSWVYALLARYRDEGDTAVIGGVLRGFPGTRHPNSGSRSAAVRNGTHGSENTTGGQRRGDPAGQPVAFFVAAHIREHSLTLVLQQPALNTGVLAPEMVSGHAVTVFARDRDTPWAC
jgi:hypothetical protein